MQNNMYVIGITGGVGAGKSEVLRYIRNHCSCCILTSDEMASQLREKGGECHEDILALLGRDILSPDGTIDRKKMAARIFSDERLLEQVNGVIHPAVKRRILATIDRGRTEGLWDALFIEAALLIENGYEQICDEIWYIYAEEAVRRKRLRDSRGYDEMRIDGIMASQSSDAQFRSVCRTVIDNSRSFEETEEQLQAELTKREIYRD